MNIYLRNLLSKLPYKLIDEEKEIYEFVSLSISADMGVEMYSKRTNLRVEQKVLARKYGFAIPNEQALTEISKFKSILEFGAGTGYWASLLRERKTNITCFDIAPIKGVHKNRYGFNTQHTHINDLTHADQVLKSRAKKSVLFLCWPCRHKNWALETSNKYIVHGGKTIIYVGDYEYDKKHPICISDDQAPVTGNENLHQFFTDNFSLVKKIEIPHYENIKDALYIFELKDPQKRV